MRAATHALPAAAIAFPGNAGILPARAHPDELRLPGGLAAERRCGHKNAIEVFWQGGQKTGSLIP